MPGATRLTDHQRRDILLKVRDGEPRDELANHYKVTIGTINRIVSVATPHRKNERSRPTSERPPELKWMDKAFCAGWMEFTDEDLTPVDKQQEVCNDWTDPLTGLAGCPVRDQCLLHSLTGHTIWASDEGDGGGPVFGGRTDQEQSVLQRLHRGLGLTKKQQQRERQKKKAESLVA